MPRRSGRGGTPTSSERRGRAPLGAEDLEALATAAYMLGRDEDVGLLERPITRIWRRERDPCCALLRAGSASTSPTGALGPASGWLARANASSSDRDCVERGYLLPVMMQQAASVVETPGIEAARVPCEIAERFGDADLLALALMGQGRSPDRAGEIEAGLGKLDEAMVAVTAESCRRSSPG